MSDLPITVHDGEGVFARSENMAWQPGREGAPYRTCGYCGSLHPEDFATADVARGGRVERADMKYGWPHKVYIDVANPEPDRVYCVGSSTEADGDRYRAWKDLTDGEREAVRSSGSLYPPERDPEQPDDFGRVRGFYFGARPSLHAKFYTVHLLEPTLDPSIADRCFARIGLVIERGEKPGSVRWRPYSYDAAPASGASS